MWYFLDDNIELRPEGVMYCSDCEFTGSLDPANHRDDHDKIYHCLGCTRYRDIIPVPNPFDLLKGLVDKMGTKE